MLRELQRIRALLANLDQKHTGSINRLLHTINQANTRQGPLVAATLSRPLSQTGSGYRGALVAHVTS